VDERALADRTARLPDMFADRLRHGDLDDLRTMAGGGEWGLLLNELVATLRVMRTPVSRQELSELQTLLTSLDMPTAELDDLVVHGR
jgi:hypothetical protein